MATRYPAEFRQRAVELARLREKPIAQLATDFGVSDQALRNWLRQADIDEGQRAGLTTEERGELVRLRRANRVLAMENEILKQAGGLLRAGERPPKMTFRLVQELAARGVLAAVTCRVLRVSTSGYYEWRGRVPSLRAVADAALSAQIREIHATSRGTYGVPRVHAELRLGRGVRCSRKRVARLMRSAKLCGIYVRRRKRGYPALPVHDDLVRRRFVADAPNRLWLTDITEHPTREGKVYLAAVLDVYARRIVGWSIADHLRAELVVDALEMARWRRRPAPGKTVLHSDRGAQYTSWAFGHRLRAAGLLGSMGRVGSAYDNAMMESFFSTLQRELLDRKSWTTRKELASAIFEWIEAWYNPRRRHTSIDDLSPVDYERLYTAAIDAA
ncbi:MAG TPA: IS3 family transposase [Dehalococcoidia bacterium]|nr:IS3 family transposase [Dehalococcoidia bacterium]